MTERPRVHVASRSTYGQIWRSFRERYPEIRVLSTWIDESGPGETDDMADLWTRCIDEARAADYLIALHIEGDTWKGAFVQIGAALASGAEVILVGYPPGSWVAHPNVRRAYSLDAAAKVIMEEVGRAQATGGPLEFEIPSVSPEAMEMLLGGPPLPASVYVQMAHRRPGAAGLTATQGHLRRRARPRPAWAWALSSRRPCWARSVLVHTHLPCAAVELHAEGVGFTAKALTGG